MGPHGEREKNLQVGFEPTPPFSNHITKQTHHSEQAFKNVFINVILITLHLKLITLHYIALHCIDRSTREIAKWDIY